MVIGFCFSGGFQESLPGRSGGGLQKQSMYLSQMLARVVVWTWFWHLVKIWSEVVGYVVFSASEVFRAFFQLSELGQIRKSVVGWDKTSEQGMEKRAGTSSVPGWARPGRDKNLSWAHPLIIKMVQSKQRSSEFCAVVFLQCCCWEIWIHSLIVCDWFGLIWKLMESSLIVFCSFRVVWPCVSVFSSTGCLVGTFNLAVSWELLLRTSSSPFPCCIYLVPLFYWTLDFLFWCSDFLIFFLQFSSLSLFSFKVWVSKRTCVYVWGVAQFF